MVVGFSLSFVVFLNSRHEKLKIKKSRADDQSHQKNKLFSEVGVDCLRVIRDGVPWYTKTPLLQLLAVKAAANFYSFLHAVAVARRKRLSQRPIASGIGPRMITTEYSVQE
jgi:hypothetical protein